MIESDFVYLIDQYAYILLTHKYRLSISVSGIYQHPINLYSISVRNNCFKISTTEQSSSIFYSLNLFRYTRKTVSKMKKYIFSLLKFRQIISSLLDCICIRQPLPINRSNGANPGGHGT